MPGMWGAVLVLELRTVSPVEPYKPEPFRNCAATAERRNHARNMQTMMSWCHEAAPPRGDVTTRPLLLTPGFTLTRSICFTEWMTEKTSSCFFF